MNYENYLMENDTLLKEEYLMQFTHAQLVEMILDDDEIENSYFSTYERSFSDFCDESYALDISVKADKERDLNKRSGI